MAMIHVARDGANIGSFSREEVQEGLRTGKFLPTDLAWQEGMPDWRPLAQVVGDKPAAAAPAPTTPPPAEPGALAPPAPAQSGAAPVVASVAAPAGKTEPLAIWSLVLSLLSFVCCGPCSAIPGVICGHMALAKFKADPNLQGKGLATAGLIIGYVSIAFWLIYIVFFGGIALLKEITHSTSR